MVNIRATTWEDLMAYISNMSKSERKYDVTFKDEDNEFFKISYISEIDEPNYQFADILEEGNHFLHIEEIEITPN